MGLTENIHIPINQSINQSKSSDSLRPLQNKTKMQLGA
jgi:hypothetical protein